MPGESGAGNKNEVKKAVYFLEQYEDEIRNADGKAIGMGRSGRQALERVRKVKKAYPDDPDVEALFQRARSALIASKGGGIPITPEMLAYRNLESRLISGLGEIAKKEWTEALAAIAGDQRVDAEPAPDPDRVAVDEVVGRWVVLEDFRWPDNQFLDTGAEYVHVGSGQLGWYFVRLRGRRYRTAYGALKRYRHTVSEDLPGPWTVLGRIAGLDLLTPDASEKSRMPAQLGWVVDPELIYVPDRLLARPAGEGATQGSFAGEGDVERIKAASYTVSSVPDNVEPKELVRIFATAIKEKNWDLFCKCVHPRWLQSSNTIARLRYYWVNNQERYRRYYVHIEPQDPKPIQVVRGERIDDTEAFFLTEEDQADIVEMAQPLIEQVHVPVKGFDERGRQWAKPKDVVLWREEQGRWTIMSGFPL